MGINYSGSGDGYKPVPGTNLPMSKGDGQQVKKDHYADRTYLRRNLEALLTESGRLTQTIDKYLSRYSLYIKDDDEKLKNAAKKEWPDYFDKDVNEISYRFYRVVKNRPSSAANYIKKRFERAARDVGGDIALDIRILNQIIYDEANLIKDLVSTYIGGLDDSSEKRTVELFQNWVYQARQYTWDLWRLLEAREQQYEIPSQQLAEATEREAKNGQAVFKSKLNEINHTIEQKVDFVQQNFSRHSSTFYSQMLAPALRYRLGVGRRVYPTGSSLTEEVYSESKKIDDNLRGVLADQIRRSRLFKHSFDEILYDIQLRSKYRSYIIQLSVIGKPISREMGDILEESQEDPEEIAHWEEQAEFEQSLIENEEQITDSVISSHNDLSDLELDSHPQYIKHSGDTLTGDIEMEEGVLIDGMRPATHTHTGEDGTAQIHGTDIIGGTLPPDLVDKTRVPPVPENLRIIETAESTAPPGVTVVDVEIAWDGDPELTYEVQIARKTSTYA